MVTHFILNASVVCGSLISVSVQFETPHRKARLADFTDKYSMGLQITVRLSSAHAQR